LGVGSYIKIGFFINFTEEFLHPKNNKIKTRVEKYFIDFRGLKTINAIA